MFIIGGLPVVAIPLILALCGVLSWWLALTLVVEVFIIGGIHGYIHDAFHLKQHWLLRFKWFRDLNVWHYAHHVRNETNYGIFWMGLDRLFGTFWRGETKENIP
jgi:sterol desaturase/sphingolipid hydroxylase (fatty acid hydroxylase superfamily)